MLKRALIGLGVILVLLLALVGGTMASIFGGLKPLLDEAALPGGGVTIKDGYAGVFLLPAGDKAVALIDCGNDATGAAILGALQKRGLGPDAVKAIFLTHGHPDHIAACHLFPKAEIYAFQGDVALAAGEARSLGPLPSRMDFPVEKRAHVTKTLEDGRVVTVGTLEVRPYHVTGHTAGSAAYLALGTLYSGDNFTIESNDKLRCAPWLFSDSTDENRRSVKQLAARLTSDNATVKALAPAHSGPADSVKPLMDYAAAN